MFTLRLRHASPPLKHLVSHTTMQVSSIGGEIGWTRPFQIETESSGFYTYVWTTKFQDLLSSMIRTRLKIEIGQEI